MNVLAGNAQMSQPPVQGVDERGRPAQVHVAVGHVRHEPPERWYAQAVGLVVADVDTGDRMHDDPPVTNQPVELVAEDEVLGSLDPV